jgi:aspartyl-tRNA synthetase
MHAYRSHKCHELNSSHVGQTVRLSGWVHRVRDHGGILFIDLRDHYGITQVLADPDSAAFADVEKVRSEWVIRIDGEVKARDAGLVNPKLATGEVEVFIREIEVLGAADELPLPVFGELDYPEETRLKYRFIDLRREGLHDNIVLRSKVISSIRNRMVDQGFMEYQTPILTASSPEGARDFLVPSRLHPGKFYALPQAPQQFKQLIMVAGFDRYFQIAPCFRDEDPRADRSPGEFYQLDMEMSFVEQEDVFQAIEPVMRGVFEEFGKGRPVTPEFPRIAYKDAMLKYGTDKPDLRNPIEMQVVSDHFAGSGFRIFAGMLEKPGNEIRAIPAPKGGSRKFCDRMNSFAQKEGLPGMGYIFWRDRVDTEFEQGLKTLATKWDQQPDSDMNADLDAFNEKWSRDLDEVSVSDEEQERRFSLYRKALRSNDLEHAEFLRLAYFGGFEAAGPLAKNIGPERTEAIRQQLDLGVGDAAFFLAGKPSSFIDVAGKARNLIGEELGLTAKDRFDFCWIIDFPMFECDDEAKKFDFSHNPFSMPQGGLEALETMDPLDILGWQYDIVCNGVELSSGAIRNHKPEIMFKAFEIAGYDKTTVEEKFGGMLNAFRFGAPPHGGIAPGIDRMVMLLADAENIREVILFPMNQRAEDLMMQAPAEATPQQMRDLGLRLTPQG